MAEKVAHLSDLFVTGKEAEITVYDPDNLDGPPHTFKVWLRKPTVQQYDEANTKARGRMARRRAVYRDPDSDEFLAIEDQLERLADKNEVVEQLLAFERSNIAQEAYNEVLYGDDKEDEPKWGKEGSEYTSVLSAMSARFQEIQKFNDELPEADANLQIKLEEDEEMLRLNSIIEEFQAERDEKAGQITEAKRAAYLRQSEASLKTQLRKKLIDLDCNVSYFEEYKSLMLYFSVRYLNDKKKPYFASPEAIFELPEFVRASLFDQYDELEQGNLIKNSLSPQPS